MKVRGWWSREALLASPVRPERLLLLCLTGFPAASSETITAGGAPTDSCRRGRASGSARAPTAPPGGLAKEEASGPEAQPAGPCSPTLCFSRGPELFKPLELSSGLGASAHCRALCLFESLSQPRRGGHHETEGRERCGQ